MVKMGRAIDDDSPAEDLHELRKVGKELRYLLEFFASLYPADIVKPFDQDAQGPAGHARPLPGPRGPGQRAADAHARGRPPATVMAMGVLVERFMHEEADARAEFADRFQPFAGHGAARAWSRRHFG